MIRFLTESTWVLAGFEGRAAMGGEHADPDRDVPDGEFAVAMYAGEVLDIKPFEGFLRDPGKFVSGEIRSGFILEFLNGAVGARDDLDEAVCTCLLENLARPGHPLELSLRGAALEF